MNVFLLYEGAYSDRQLRGVFGSLELAKTAAADIAKGWDHLEPHEHIWTEHAPYLGLEEPYWFCRELLVWRAGDYQHEDQMEIEERAVRVSVTDAARLQASAALEEAIG